MRKGRIDIFTDKRVIDENNIIDILIKASGSIQQNAIKCSRLLDYESGDQPLVREKTYRPDINIEDIDNVANEVTEFHTGFDWGNVITLVQRGTKDSGSTDENSAVALLNEFYSLANIGKVQQELARYVEICGVGYTYVDVNTEYEEGESPFTVDCLSPENTFVIKSSYYTNKRVMISGTWRKDETGNVHYICYTKDKRFDILNLRQIVDGEEIDEWVHEQGSGQLNPFGKNPIVEWVRSFDRQGGFERQIDEMNTLNIMESDWANGLDQDVQSIWHCNDVDFPTVEIQGENGETIEVVKKPKSNDFLQTFTSQDGTTPFVKPLANNYDYVGILSGIKEKRAQILEKCFVPSRNDNSGGSTGIAMSDATGWTQSENFASKKEIIMSDCKMEEVRLVLKAIQLSKLPLDNPVRSLRAIDVIPNIKRQKSFELTTKANFIATLISHGFNGQQVIKEANAFTDAQQVWADSKEGIERYQESIFSKGESANVKDRLQADYSDQEENSPSMK